MISQLLNSRPLLNVTLKKPTRLSAERLAIAMRVIQMMIQMLMKMSRKVKTTLIPWWVLIFIEQHICLPVLGYGSSLLPQLHPNSLQSN